MKARRDSPTSSLDEPEAASLWTEIVVSNSDKDFSEISEKFEKSVSTRIKETETNQREFLKMIDNLSSKIDTLSGRVPGTTVSETNETNHENMASTSRATELNEMTQVGGHYSFSHPSLTKLTKLHTKDHNMV